eukprot:maker-scaffold1052_size66809-snap-gene-0.17 protein:Tk03047 transcript:maker-scaffold1052_size66809-snap-gene-0.17-mRNA-1 annotation:"soma ferritin"
MATLSIRQHFHTTSEATINKQINMELYASYVYTSMFAYFNRDDVALQGFAKFFRKNADEERDHAYKLIEYQNMRGGKVVFHDITKPTTTEWGSALNAMENALTLEKTVNQSLLELHKVADDNSDYQLSDFISAEYLKEQATINKQINMELYASYVYTSMFAYFNRDDVALQGFAKFFRKNADEEHDHAYKLIEYQNMRGGKVVFHDITKPTTTEWGSALNAVENALALEKTVNQSLLDLHKLADDNNDYNLSDFVGGEYLKDQVKDIKEMGDLLTKMRRAGDGLGLHMMWQSLWREAKLDCELAPTGAKF